MATKPVFRRAFKERRWLILTDGFTEWRRREVEACASRNPIEVPQWRRNAVSSSSYNEPLWVRLYVDEIGEVWAAMIVGDAVLPPEPGRLIGLAFFGPTCEEAEQKAKAYLGLSEPKN